MKTYEDLTSKISVAGADTPAKAAGTKITIDTSADGLKEGDKLTIGEKTYVFTKDPTSVTGDNLVGVDISTPANVAANLNTALGNNGMTSEVSGTNAVIVRAAAEGKGIPQVSGSGLTLQIGESSDSFNQLGLRIGDMHVTAMGTMDDAGVVTSIDDIDISNQKGAQDAVAVIKDAINYVSSIRGDLGATQNRLEHTANNLSVMAENIQDAESTIRDTDVAEEMMAYTKNNILVQAAQAMLAQANAVPQGVLQLLQ